ncbi:MAG: BON domain-containing protein [Actinomycetota bacterium]|nr:BON domain-containing protein [Actinomycetota bacterium]
MWFALAAAAGAALAFFLDPTSGRRRRATAAQRVPGFFRHRSREAGRLGRSVSAEAYGLKQKATHLRERPKGDLDDATIAHKIETELFRPADVPKGQINVNVQEGVVQLRGEVPNPDMIDDLVAKARSIQGVRDVENLLHLPGTPAPTHH